MTIGETRKKIEQVLDIYRNRLDNIHDDLFMVRPPGGGWSCSEVYCHILRADLSSTVAIEKCTLNNCMPTSKGRTFIGLAVLSFGRFPPFRVKTPKEIAEKNPVRNITKEEARNLIIKCRKRLEEVVPLIHSSSKHKRIRHARMGMLNARQWLKFILIHSKHHLKQLDRVEKKLQGG
jgi:hypothetical protein